jgi:hypothetical protein
MLPLADGYLHLGKYVPVRFCVIDQVARSEEFDHGRPKSAQAVIRRKTLP